jgi:hypothetical protein
MSPEQIIELAKKCGWNNPANNMMPLYEFANLVAQLERERIASSIEKLPFGDTAASFGIYVRNL